MVRPRGEQAHDQIHLCSKPGFVAYYVPSSFLDAVSVNRGKEWSLFIGFLWRAKMRWEST